jgi:hypothetical protein
MTVLKAIVCAVCLLVPVSVTSDALAAPKRVTGAALAGLLYGRAQTVTTPDGESFRVRYDTNGTMYVDNKGTGTVVKATNFSWCSFVAKKLNRCVTIWEDGGVYGAKQSDGSYAFVFTIL